VNLPTSIAGLELRELTVDDADRYYELLQANRPHLTQFGDYDEEVNQTLDEVHEYFVCPTDENYRYGIWASEELVGRVDLSPVDPPQFLIGFWLARNATGLGYATAACRAIIQYGRDELEASDIYGGVTHGNHKCAAVLKRLGFAEVAAFEDHTRFHYSCG
jgi:RimJ/RimL family protein N-acetyltransferase